MIISDAHLHFDYLSPNERDAVWLSSDHMVLSAGVWPSETMTAIQTFGSHQDKVFWGAGLHPTYIHKHYVCADMQTRANAELIALARSNSVQAIGETGFDLHQTILKEAMESGLDSDALLRLQWKAFRTCAEAALNASKPLILHSRGAWQWTIQAIQDVRASSPDLPIMIHCFPGSAAEVEKLAKLRVYLSFGGVLTWPTAKRMKDALKVCPRELILLETDAPDLPPFLADGTRPEKNSPTLWLRILEVAASLRGENPADLAQLARENLGRFLRTDWV